MLPLMTVSDIKFIEHLKVGCFNIEEKINICGNAGGSSYFLNMMGNKFENIDAMDG